MPNAMEPALLVSFQNVNEADIENVIWAIQFGEARVEILCDGRSVLVIDQPWEKSIQLESLSCFLEFPMVKASLRQAKKLYRKIKKSNCAIRCSLRIGEIILHEFGSCRLVRDGFLYPFKLIDNYVLVCLIWVGDNFPVVAMTPEEVMAISWLRLYIALRRRGIDLYEIEDYAVDKIKSLIRTALSTLPKECVPGPFLDRDAGGEY